MSLMPHSALIVNPTGPFGTPHDVRSCARACLSLSHAGDLGIRNTQNMLKKKDNTISGLLINP